MTAIDKNELLDHLEERVEAHLRIALEVFQNSSSDTLLRPAAGGGWSIAQCLEHLNRYGLYYIPRIHQALQQAAHQQGGTFTSGWLGRYFTRRMSPDTGAKKMRAFKEYVPPVQLEAHAVVATFIRQQEDLLDCLEKARKADLGSCRIPVSILPWIKLKVGDIFPIVIEHDERHVRQAKRNV